MALEAALADPIDSYVIGLLRHYGANVPLPDARAAASRFGRTLPQLRNRQHRLAALLTANGEPPSPVLATGEIVALRLKPRVHLRVVSLSRTAAQLQAVDEPRLWMSVPLRDLVRVEPVTDTDNNTTTEDN